MTEKKNKKIYININIFEIYLFFYFFILFIYLFIYFFLLLFSGTQLRICVQVATPLHLSILTQHTCNSLAKTCLVWRVKINFISNKTLNIGTFPVSIAFLTPYRTRDVKIQNFPSRNNQKNHMTRRLPILQFARKPLRVSRVKMNFIQNKSLNDGTLSRFKRLLMPYRPRDMKIQNSCREIFKRIGYHTSSELTYKLFTQRSQKHFTFGSSIQISNES